MVMYLYTAHIPIRFMAVNNSSLVGGELVACSSKQFTLNARFEVQELDLHHLKELTELIETKRQRRRTMKPDPETVQAQHNL